VDSPKKHPHSSQLYPQKAEKWPADRESVDNACADFDPGNPHAYRPHDLSIKNQKKRLRVVGTKARREWGEAVPAETKLLLKALRREAVPRAPIWLMRQAGRYLPEYRAVRRQARDFLELCYTPDLSVEVTLQPIRRFGMDAAILFSDILVVADALGCRVEFVEGEGPKLAPVRDHAAIEKLSEATLSDRLAPVYETVRRLATSLPADVALIGFAGAPWTVAAYMVEGEGSRDFTLARSLAWRDPDAFEKLIALLTRATTKHLLAQIDAGAEVVQLFDSWAGALSELEFIRWSQAPLAAIIRAIRQARPGVPVIVFPRGAGARYASFAQAVRPDGLSLDTGVPLSWAREQLRSVCLQGNLDPVALLTGGDVLRNETERILRTLAGSPFVFNLGHGVLPETDPGAVAVLVDQVKSAPLADSM
jgi:uroporphyrinogen decarboxylase